MIGVVLASASESRARLLKAAGVRFDVVKPIVDEAALKRALIADKIDPADAATALAELKIEHVASRRDDDVVIVSADQLLVMDDHWYDKPADRATARKQLQELRGHRHRLYAAAVAWRHGARVGHHVGVADLWMRDFDDDFLDHYLGLAGGETTDSVGAYHLEGLGAQLMSRLEGDWFSVLGMPLFPVLQWLRDQGALRH